MLPATVNSITVNGERSAGLLKGIPLGVLKPGVNVLKTLKLFSTGAGGDRVLDISIQSRSAVPRLDHSLEVEIDTTETLRTLVVPTVAPIRVVYNVGYRRPLGAQLGLADLRNYDCEFWDESSGGEAVVTANMECAGPWSLKIDSLKLIRQVRAFGDLGSRSVVDAGAVQDSDQAKIVESHVFTQDESMFVDGALVSPCGCSVLQFPFRISARG
jgi:hypothetical protein